MWNVLYGISKDVLWWVGGYSYHVGTYMIYGKQKTINEIIQDQLQFMKSSEEIILMELMSMRKELNQMHRIFNHIKINQNVLLKHSDDSMLITCDNFKSTEFLEDSILLTYEDIEDDVKEIKQIEDYRKNKNNVQYIIDNYAK